jgi:hypothetical protein
MKCFHKLGFATAVVVASVAAGGCAPAAAPGGLEELARFIFDRFEITEGTDVGQQDAELRQAFINLDEALADLDTPMTEETPYKSVLEDIEEKHVEDLEGVAPRLGDLPLAQGLVTANVVKCSLKQNQNLTLSKDTSDVHGDIYSDYEKVFDEDPAAFADGETNQLFWRLNYRIGEPPVGSPYSATTRGGARRVVSTDDDKSPFGDLFITRVHLPEPAEFEGDGSEFTLDFQLETYHENSDGNLVHFYAMWRRMKLGIIDSQQDIFINTSLDGMVDWDKETEVACADGRADSRD